ncbi:uncharacterized protein LOC126661677 [Mercurialis annua]|uniref:uncharacterized protein LOC126661677 n=1 Tax=Mercurialis annua TaxID=3986 RepID=UPI0024AF2C04|nr:uncharacterized protein LOC126661677 [Mercurialis annua]
MDREWMYVRLEDGYLHPRFAKGVEEFVEFAKRHPQFMDGAKIRCPCNHTKCRNKGYLDEVTVMCHLGKNGFMQNYYCWYNHGETYVPNLVRPDHNIDLENTCHQAETSDAGDLFRSMMDDVIGRASVLHPSEDVINPPHVSHSMEESPNMEAQRLYDMLKASEQELWEGNPGGHSQLSAVARLMNLKAEFHFSERLYDELCKFLSEVLPTDNVMTDSFYSTKKLVRKLGLPVEVIDCCKQGCMLFWNEDIGLNSCKVCGHPRFKKQGRGSNKRKINIPYMKMHYFPLTPRLQRLYASHATSNHMRWHGEHEWEEDGVMRHCSDSPAWKHFNEANPSFASEVRNVRLGLCTDGFQPFGQTGRQYSSWPVIVTPYNLPPGMCMKEEYMFLTAIIPGPKNPKDKLDVFLQPLIAELKHLWEVGVNTYDISVRQNFQMRAALMWTISDFPAYSMLSGWSTGGKLACPHCMGDSDAFSLTKGRKTSWFDNHRKFLPPNHSFRKNKKWFRKGEVVLKIAPDMQSGSEILDEIEHLGLKKVTDINAEEENVHISKLNCCGWKKRSIFWDLPYWSSNLIRHNLDVMHIEKNFFDNIFNTVMNVTGKTKDNAKSREDLKEFCDRPELHKDERTGKYPKASFTLDKKGKEELCNWVRELKFPDGYVSNMGRCVDMKKLKFYGMKSHDSHVFMQRLIPIAFRELLPANVWQVLTELSLFFKSLTSTVIRREDIIRLEQEIPIILCKLERIFPPSFFDSMEHLPIHLPHEARIAGPVQYRWMYPFERYLRRLKNNVTNKSQVEGSISNAYLVEETASFCAHYFKPTIHTRHRRAPRNDDGGVDLNAPPGMLSIFKHPGRSMGQAKSRYLEDKEYHAAHTYILLNCIEVKPYIHLYEDELRIYNPNITNNEVELKLENNFADWFEKYAHSEISNITNPIMQDLAKGPLHEVKWYSGYYVNGYKFHTEGHGSRRLTTNSGVCIRGSNSSTSELDFYGKLTEIIELDYPALPIKKVVLFKCSWFDPTPRLGIRVHPQLKLVDVNCRRVFNKYEPFIMAVQAEQVHYLRYPTSKRNDWLAVCKIKPRFVVEVPDRSDLPVSPTVLAYQEDSIEHHEVDSQVDVNETLVDPNDFVTEIDDVDDVENDGNSEKDLNDDDDDDHNDEDDCDDSDE